MVSVPLLVTTGLGHQRGDGSDVGRSVLSYRSQHVPVGQDAYQPVVIDHGERAYAPWSRIRAAASASDSS